jgi:hypothetical protein
MRTRPAKSAVTGAGAMARAAPRAASATWGAAASGRKARQDRVEYRGIVEWGIQWARV